MNALILRDALHALGSGDAKLLERLDRALGNALLGAAPITEGVTLALIGPKNEAIKIAKGLVDKRAKNWASSGYRTRQEQITAAHTVIVIIAYFDALSQHVNQPLRKVGIKRDDQVNLFSATDIARKDDANETLTRKLLNIEVPIPSGMTGYGETVKRIRLLYAQLAPPIERFLSGLAFWDSLDETQQVDLRSFLRTRVPDDAIDRYNGLFRELATSAPEFFVWALMTEFDAVAAGSQATQTRLDELQVILTKMHDEGAGAFNGMRSFLDSLSTGTHIIDDLATSNADALQRPLAGIGITGDYPSLRIPTIQEGYIRPYFKVFETGDRVESLSDESWWKGRPVRRDFQTLITSLVTEPASLHRTILLLGQPGAGKSLLCKVIAATLPTKTFTPIVVKLREVSASAPIQTQIEEALYHELGRTVNYVELIQNRSDTIPVVFLDGFDELLQASGVGRSEYLERVNEFQERELSLSRGTVVIVTSRTVVADKARSPHGTAVVRLEPFDDEQVRRWIAIWNEVNEPYYNQSHLKRLDPNSVLCLGDLSREPLLLALLAFYDATTNGLPRDGTSISRTALYEQLLRVYMQREVRRDTSARRADERVQIERHIQLLSLVALAMFNRGVQKITEGELEQDFRALGLQEAGRDTYDSQFEAFLHTSTEILGRFFFIVESKATLGTTGNSAAYEFLHATFGEYLVARQMLTELSDLTMRKSASSVSRWSKNVFDDSRLFALASHQSLFKRAQIVDFLTEAATSQGEVDSTSEAKGLITELLDDGLSRAQELPVRFEGYNPSHLTPTARHAVYLLNLFTFRWAIGRPILLRDLAPPDVEALEWWRRLVRYWYGGIDPQSWEAFLDIVGLAEDGLVLLPGIVKPGKLAESEHWQLRAWAAAHHLGEYAQQRAVEIAGVVDKLLPYATEYSHVDSRLMTIDASPLLMLRLQQRPVDESETLLLTYLSAVGLLADLPPDSRGFMTSFELLTRQMREDLTALPREELPQLIDQLVELAHRQSSGQAYGGLFSLIMDAFEELGLSYAHLPNLLARVDLLGYLDRSPLLAARLFLAIQETGIFDGLLANEQAADFDIIPRTDLEFIADVEFVLDRLDLFEIGQEDAGTAIDLLAFGRRRGLYEWAAFRAYPFMVQRSALIWEQINEADVVFCCAARLWGVYFDREESREARQEIRELTMEFRTRRSGSSSTLSERLLAALVEDPESSLPSEEASRDSWKELADLASANGHALGGDTARLVKPLDSRLRRRH